MKRAAHKVFHSFSVNHFRMLSSTAMASACLFASVPAHALPAGGVQDGGAAGDITIVTGVSTVDITQTSNNGVINWNTFNIAGGETVNFAQPAATSATLNRVTADVNPSQIQGALNANGRVVIVNPNGVVFTDTATVNVGGLIASTADITTSDFNDGGSLSFGAAGATGATVENQGTITTTDKGIVALVAPNVRNSGVITANQGSVMLAAGETATLDFYGDGLINFSASTVSGNSGGNNAVTQTATGEIHAASGKVLVTANAAAAVVDRVINLDGVVEADSLVAGPDGEITITGAGNVLVEAPLKAQKIKVNATGGHDVVTKNLTAKAVDETKTAQIEIGGNNVTTGMLSVTGVGSPTAAASHISLNAAGDAEIDGISVLIEDTAGLSDAYRFTAQLFGTNIHVLSDILIHLVDQMGAGREARAGLVVNASNNATFDGDITVLSEASVQSVSDTGRTSASVEINAGGDIVGHNIGAKALGGDNAEASVCINACRRVTRIKTSALVATGGDVTLDDVVAIGQTSAPPPVVTGPTVAPGFGARGNSRADIQIYGRNSVTTDEQIAQAYGGYDARATINSWSGDRTGLFPSGGPLAVSNRLDEYGTDLSGGTVTTGNVFAQAITGDADEDNGYYGYGFSYIALATADLTAGNAVTSGSVTASSRDNYDAASYVDVESGGTVQVGSLFAEANTPFIVPFSVSEEAFATQLAVRLPSPPGYLDAEATVRIVADGTITGSGANITYTGADPRAQANDTSRQSRYSDYQSSEHAFSQLIIANPPPSSGGGGGAPSSTVPVVPTVPGGDDTPPPADNGEGPGAGTSPATPAPTASAPTGFDVLEELFYDYDNGFFRGLYSYFGETLGNPYYYGNTNVSLTLLAAGGGGVGGSGGFTPAQLGNLSPAAGGSPEDLGRLSPSAGGGASGQGNGSGQCGNNFLDEGFSPQFNAASCREEGAF